MQQPGGLLLAAGSTATDGVRATGAWWETDCHGAARLAMTARWVRCVTEQAGDKILHYVLCDFSFSWVRGFLDSHLLARNDKHGRQGRLKEMGTGLTVTIYRRERTAGRARMESMRAV